MTTETELVEAIIQARIALDLAQDKAEVSRDVANALAMDVHKAEQALQDAWQELDKWTHVQMKGRPRQWENLV
jgi:phage gp36-like protein